MLSFEEKRALFNSYKELSESHFKPDKYNYYCEGSKQRGKVVVRELVHTGNAYICGRYLAGFDGRKDARRWIKIKDFTEVEIRELLDRVIEPFK